jgi:DNA-binding IclR family transcriptional regulator
LTAQLAIIERGECVLIGKVVPPGALSIPSWLGKRMQTHCTALGKMIIAHIGDEIVTQIIKEHGLARHNENTITSSAKLSVELDKIRDVGWALNDEEYVIGVRCVAAPVFDNQGRVNAAVSVSGTVSQITPENCTALSESVKRTAAAISERLGGCRC